MNALMNVLPSGAVSLIRRWLHSKKGEIGFFGNLIISNVPGPKEYLYLEKWKLDNWFSTGQITDGTALNITLWSYAGKANLCILVDREVLADGWILFNHFVAEIETLSALMTEPASQSENNA